AGGRRLEGDQRRRVEFTTIRRDGRLCCRIKVLVVVEGAIVETPTGGILHMHVHDVAAGIIGQPGNGRWHRDLNVGIADDRPRSGRRVVGIVGSSYGLVTEVNLRDVPETLAENI